jgi:cleavage stimulation factor subunit 2
LLSNKVGNIPYGTTEEQLHQIFSEAGRIVNIRTVVDHETGKTKGYAFVEFEDSSTALSAIRNLNGYECNGRQLRVNYSSNNSLTKAEKAAAAGGDEKSAPVRTVKNVVDSMSIHEVYDIVAGMKDFVEKEADQAKQMLTSHPQVAEALMLMQVRLGMLKPDQIQMRKEVEAVPSQPVPLLPPQAQQPPPPQQQQQQQQQQPPPGQYQPIPPQMGMQPIPPQSQQYPPPQFRPPPQQPPHLVHHPGQLPPAAMPPNAQPIPNVSYNHYGPASTPQPNQYQPQQPPPGWHPPPVAGGYQMHARMSPQQLSALPPDQRAQYEAAMRQQHPQNPPSQQQHHQRRY